MAGGAPKESEESKRERERQRRMAEMERRKAAKGTAADLTTDLAAVYGRPSIFRLPR